MYKIIDFKNSYEDYWGKKHIKYITVDFDQLCEIKNINKKTVNKSGYTKQSTKRDSLSFIHKNTVANMFGVSNYTKLFNDEGEAIASSKTTTMAYIKSMGLNLDDYEFLPKQNEIEFANYLLRMAA